MEALPFLCCTCILFRCFFKSCGFCRLLLAKLPAVFLMTRALFLAPFFLLQIVCTYRTGARAFEHPRPWTEPRLKLAVIQDICLHGLSAVFLSEVSDKLQEFFVCHFFIWRSNLIQLLDFLCCCQVRIVLYALFYFSLIHLLPSLVSMLPFVPAGGVTCWHRP